MHLEVILFAIYKERLKSNSITVQIPQDSTVEQLVIKLKQDFPALASSETDIVVAVNAEYADYNLTLRESDEICLIPPVSGG